MTAQAQDPSRALALLVLAAGKGTRLRGGEDAPPKVLLDCLGAPLIEHVKRSLSPLAAQETVVVTGHRAEEVDAWLTAHWAAARRVHQIPQKGTGHAARLALEALEAFRGDVLLVYGDVPQLRSEDLEGLLALHRGSGAAASVLTGVVDEPGLLGRIVRGPEGRFQRIVEARDATPAELGIHEFNTGIYAFRSEALRAELARLSSDNAQGEEYATDVVGALAAAGAPVEALPSADPTSLRGGNDWTDLAVASSVLRRRIATAHMRRGVRITEPDTTVIEVDVEIEAGAHILPFTHIARGCRIGAGASVGPFARLRGATVLEAGAQIGNFVEVKGSLVRAGAKAKHLTYLGDAEVGERANVGCGTITANYDGVRKHRTLIGARARIGSGTVLVAPVRVGEDGRTGANAVVLAGRDVPAGATAVGVPARVLASPEEGDAPQERSAPPSEGQVEEDSPRESA